MNNPANTPKVHLLSNLQRLSKRIENVEVQLQDERRYFEHVIEQLRLDAIPVEAVVATPTPEVRLNVDRRSLPNTEKNLKISARRSFAWSYGMDEQVAHTRAMTAVERRAKALGLKAVPKGVVEYVDKIAKQFDQIKPKSPRQV